MPNIDIVRQRAVLFLVDATSLVPKGLLVQLLGCALVVTILFGIISLVDHGVVSPAVAERGETVVIKAPTPPPEPSPVRVVRIVSTKLAREVPPIAPPPPGFIAA